MLVLQLVHRMQQPLYLGNLKAIELLVGVREIDPRQVLQELVQQLLHLHELNLKECVRCQCSCGQVVAPRVVKALELF